VVRGEGLSRGSAGDLVHHRSFYFEVAALVEEGADGAKDGGALDENLADVGGSESTGSGSDTGLRFRLCRFSWPRGRRWRCLLRCARVHEEVDVALAVAEFRVFEAVVLVGRASMALARR